jgi:hypothetical protein
MERLVDRYLETNPAPETYRFLETNYRGLIAGHGSVIGIRVPIPRLLPLQNSA